MKSTNKNSTRFPKILKDKGNISLISSSTELSDDCYTHKKQDEHQGSLPIVSYKLRSRSTRRPVKRTSEADHCKASPQKKSIKNSPKSKPTERVTKQLSSKKVTRTKSVMHIGSNASSIRTGRYLLRSNSVQKKNEISPVYKDSNNVFRTPKPPKKSLSELKKKTTPVQSQPDDLNCSQLSDFSCCSVSNTLLSRFIKQKSKLRYKENGKNLKHMRKLELSQEILETASMNSLEDVASISSSIDPTRRILNLCGQSEIVTWNVLFDDPSYKTEKKIGEGVYGEVYRLLNGDVLKIFPVNGTISINGEEQMDMEDVFSEVYVSKKLTELNQSTGAFVAPNYVQLQKSKLVKGKLPVSLINQWKDYESAKGTENELLDFLPVYQNWILLVYEFAGEPLCDYKFSSKSQARCVLEQVALSLAVAETSMMFEHRDLHWQNILVKETDLKEISYKLNNNQYKASCDGIFVTLIDFTVSRMSIDSTKPVSNSNIAYMDMSECTEIFEGEGDYQFEIYRMMKNDNNNNWRDFHPRSNIYWLHYLLDKMINIILYPRVDPEGRMKEFELRQLYRRILDYKSTQELIEKDPYFHSCRIPKTNSIRCNRSARIQEYSNKENYPKYTNITFESSSEDRN